MDGCTNHASLGESSAEDPSRLATLEVRLQTQEDEITLLKSVLADVLRRIHFYDEQFPLLQQQLETATCNSMRCVSPSDWNLTGRKQSLSSAQETGRRGVASIVSNADSHIDAEDVFLSYEPRSTQRHGARIHGCGNTTTFISTGTQTEESTLQQLIQGKLLPQQSIVSAPGPSQNPTHTCDVDTLQSAVTRDDLRSQGPVLIPNGEGILWTKGLADEVNNVTVSPCPILARPIQQHSAEEFWHTACTSPEEILPYQHKHGPPATQGIHLEQSNKETSTTQPTEPPKFQGAGHPLPHLTGHQEIPSPGTKETQSENCDNIATVPAVQVLKDTKKELFRRNSSSDKLVKDAVEKNKLKLSKKAASTANLLTRSSSLENRVKDLTPSAGSSSPRRGTYNLEKVSTKMFLRGRPITMYIPSNIQNYEDLRTELPSEKLQLEWVYGYRGRDCRCNLYLLASGEVVYFIACVVVLYHIQQKTQRHYLRHTDCVRCLAVHPDKVRVATGQTAGVDKDGKPLQPFVHIWDSSTLLTLQQIGLGCFERGVGSLAFSVADYGAYLCVVDDSNEHMLSVWDCVKGNKQAEIKSTNESVLTVEFSPTDSSNIITSGKSHIYFWTWQGSTLTKKQGIFGKYKKPKFIQCFVFSANGDVLTGDSEGNILTWGKTAADIRTLGKGAKETFQIVKQSKAHEGSIFSLCLLRCGSVLSGGGKDRRIIQWSPSLVVEKETEIPEWYGPVRTIAEGDKDELLIGTTRNALLRGSFSEGFTPIIQGHTDELWGLATHPSQNLFLTCSYDKQVCMWHSSEHTLAWSTTLEESGLCADFHPSGKVAAVGLNTGRWLVLDTETRQVVSHYTDGNEQLSVVRFSPDGNFLAVGSHDNFIYMYSVAENERKYSRFGKCSGHSSFITHLDWSKDSKFIMSNSGDYEILYWDVAGGCKLLRNRFESRDREWASYTCVLGFHVFGVWPDGSDGTDINSLCRSHNEKVVAVADDFCKVHLFQYPCAKPKAPSHMYAGHGSHVTNVRFTHNDSHLISMGGKDTSIFQWRMYDTDLVRSHSTSLVEPARDP
ncbi:echinoderm microtubule-associated protein-like 3 isoform X2 [Microcaecilia unicolor]|uniref:Echinoderm microtubule-associated protein-like 3 isoform X2 n=1 Tax=Microcaecilia unicolor TaxID=1415580 RepID=A0A6P7ZDL9_9AMPH|nr:echinoderm microtubule-associated protein-like 3 isoform X2 [Microcaecilia unicolor]